VYTNCFLATLNARKKIREAGSTVYTAAQDLSLSRTRLSNIAAMGIQVRWKMTFFSSPVAERQNDFVTQQPANISIKIDTTQEVATDEHSDCSGDPKTMKVGSLGATAC